VTTTGTGRARDAPLGSVSVPASTCPAGVATRTSSAVYGAFGGAE
jgi:hypothetical protein